MSGAWRRAVRAAAVRKPKREAEGVRANGPNGFPLSKTKHVFPIGATERPLTRAAIQSHARITFVQNGSGSSQNNGTLAVEPQSGVRGYFQFSYKSSRQPLFS